MSLDVFLFQYLSALPGVVHAVTGWTKDQLKDMPEHRD